MQNTKVLRGELPTLESSNSLYFSGESVTGLLCMAVAVVMRIILR